MQTSQQQNIYNTCTSGGTWSTSHNIENMLASTRVGAMQQHTGNRQTQRPTADSAGAPPSFLQPHTEGAAHSQPQSPTHNRHREIDNESDTQSQAHRGGHTLPQSHKQRDSLKHSGRLLQPHTQPHAQPHTETHSPTRGRDTQPHTVIVELPCVNETHPSSSLNTTPHSRRVNKFAV